MKGKAVLAGYGVRGRRSSGLDDYKGLDVKGKIVVVRRFVPEHEKLATPEAQRRAGDLRKKAFVARTRARRRWWWSTGRWRRSPTKPAPTAAERSRARRRAEAEAAARRTTASTRTPAAAELPPEAPLPTLHPEGTGDAGCRCGGEARRAREGVEQLEAKKKVDVELAVALDFERTAAFNVVGRIAAAKPHGERRRSSSARTTTTSATAAPTRSRRTSTSRTWAPTTTPRAPSRVLEIARELSAKRAELTRDVIVVAFSGEEAGVLGSHGAGRLQARRGSKGAVAMLNLDMVGRLRMNSLTVLGSESATEWKDLVAGRLRPRRACSCKPSGDGYGPSDQTAVLHRGPAGAALLHRRALRVPQALRRGGDDQRRGHGAGGRRGRRRGALADAEPRSSPTRRSPRPPGKGDARSFNAALGTVPDYGGPPAGMTGVLLADVRPGGGADKAGMKRGDVLVKLGKYEVRSVEDLMFVLMQSKPGETVTAVVLRDGKPVQARGHLHRGPQALTAAGAREASGRARPPDRIEWCGIRARGSSRNYLVRRETLRILPMMRLRASMKVQ